MHLRQGLGLFQYLVEPRKMRAFYRHVYDAGFRIKGHVRGLKAKNVDTHEQDVGRSRYAEKTYACAHRM
jgi:hypothetical protein